jgi:hypothetical protein
MVASEILDLPDETVDVVLRRLETEPSLIGASAHLIAVDRK